MPRYVILEHDHPSLHWDLMIEAGDVLRTWRLAAPPQLGESVKASASFDHRCHYLDYEGPISGQRGRVVRYDSGTFTWISDEADRLILLIKGERLDGRAVLQKAETDDWSFLIEPAGAGT